MRAAFFLLLLANLLFFAWAQGYFGARQSEGREPQRLAAQLTPEKIHVRDGSTTPIAAPIAAQSGNQAAALPTEGCRLVAVQPIEDADRLKTALAKLAPEIVATLRPVTEVQSYWVHIPPLANRQAAEKRSAELKKLGVAEYYVVQDEGPNRYAVSLGLFRSEQAANEFVDVLSRKGVKTARIQVRNKEPDKAGLELRGPAERFAGAVHDLLTRSPAAVADCPK